MAQGRSYQASADILPCVFVKITGVNTVATAGAGDAACGVSHEGTTSAPLPGVTGYAALNGFPVTVYGEGEPCEVVCAAAITAGTKVKSDANGNAVAATSGSYFLGEAVNTTSASGQKLKITFTRGYML